MRHVPAVAISPTAANAALVGSVTARARRRTTASARRHPRRAAMRAVVAVVAMHHAVTKVVAVVEVLRHAAMTPSRSARPARSTVRPPAALTKVAARRAKAVRSNHRDRAPAATAADPSGGSTSVKKGLRERAFFVARDRL